MLPLVFLLSATTAQADPLIDVIADELTRVQTALHDQPDPPYWIGVGVVETEGLKIEAAHGAAGAIDRSHRRVADVDIRVGSPKLDSTHQIRDGGWFGAGRRDSILLPIEDGAEPEVRRLLWVSLDDAYRDATKRLIKVRNNASIKVEATDTSADFSDAPVVKDIQEVSDFTIDEAAWRDRVRALSALLLDYEGVHDTNVSLTASRSIHRLVTTEGTRIRFSEIRLRVFIWAGTTAEDGMELELADYVDARSVDALPSDEALQ